MTPVAHLPVQDRVTAATVLFVEDNEDTFWLLEELLRYEIGVGHAEGCTRGQRLFEVIVHKQLQPDLILLDLQMPLEDGFAVFQRIRACPALAFVPVVAVTANVLSQYVVRAREAGMNGFIGKPLNRHRFPAQIARILAGETVWEPNS